MLTNLSVIVAQTTTTPPGDDLDQFANFFSRGPNFAPLLPFQGIAGFLTGIFLAVVALSGGVLVFQGFWKKTHADDSPALNAKANQKLKWGVISIIFAFGFYTIVRIFIPFLRAAMNA